MFEAPPLHLGQQVSGSGSGQEHPAIGRLLRLLRLARNITEYLTPGKTGLPAMFADLTGLQDPDRAPG